MVVSILIEALRRAPRSPDTLPWAPDIPIRHATVHGIRLRYIEAGSGPTLLLLHTMRTQLDLFQRVIPALAARHRVIEGADHSLSQTGWERAYTELLVNWLSEMTKERTCVDTSSQL